MLQAGTGSLQGGTGDGVWTSRKMGNRVELSPFTAIWDGNPFFPQPCRVHPTKATRLPSLHAEGLAPPQIGLRSPLLSFVMVCAAKSPSSWQKAFANSQKSFYTTFKLHFGQCG